MFRHPAWAVGSYSSSPVAAGTVEPSQRKVLTKQTGHPILHAHIENCLKVYTSQVWRDQQENRDGKNPSGKHEVA